MMRYQAYLALTLILYAGTISQAGQNTFLLRDQANANHSNPVSNKFFCDMKPGIRAFESPVQAPLNHYKTIRKQNYQLMLMDDFSIKGLVLSKRNYIADERADIAPVDLVLGWMRMSDPHVLKDIEIAQNHRFYYWHVDEYPIPRKELESNSTNLHLIPDNKKIRDALLSIKRGEIVELKGQLVDVKDKDGNLWVTSRSREDVGDGACEILLVKHLQTLKQ